MRLPVSFPNWGLRHSSSDVHHQKSRQRSRNKKAAPTEGRAEHEHAGEEDPSAEREESARGFGRGTGFDTVAFSGYQAGRNGLDDISLAPTVGAVPEVSSVIVWSLLTLTIGGASWRFGR